MWNFTMYFADDQDHFEYDPSGYHGSAATQRTYPYQESLLSFLELDCAQVQHQLREISTHWDAFFSSGDTTCADDAMKKMGALAAQHIYFQLLYVQWFARKADSILEPKMAEELCQLSAKLPMYQSQVQTFLERILDIDKVGREIQQNVRRQCPLDGPCDPALFAFQPIPVSFGPVSAERCGPILYPNTIRDLIDFSLQECVISGTPVRRCRNCGRYFPLTGRVTAEYCERPNADRKPCRNTGAVQKWTESQKDNLAFKEYRREYKRHFAWIKAGKLSAEEFAAWSKQAQDKKKDCADGRMSLDEFKLWLKDS